MTKIFISHATVDRRLAQLLVDLLKEGIGVPHGAIFCSSVKGHGVPFTADFNEYMKTQIQKPKLVFLLMTPSYLESAFCLMELGASWANSLHALPIVVKPVGFDMVSKTLGLKQGWSIDDPSGLIDLRKMVIESVEVEPRDDHTWEQKRANWKLELKKALKDLAKPTKVDEATHKAALELVADQAKEIEALQDLLDAANEKVVALSAAKDPAEVKAVLAGFAGDGGAEEEFEALLSAVGDARPKHASTSVFKHILTDYFGKASTINWFTHDREDFETASKYNLMSADDGYEILWKGPKLLGLRKAIGEVVAFLESDEGRELALMKAAEGWPMEADDLEFWEFHLSL